jgi:hypothetical protein
MSHPTFEVGMAFPISAKLATINSNEQIDISR